MPREKLIRPCLKGMWALLALPILAVADGLPDLFDTRCGDADSTLVGLPLVLVDAAAGVASERDSERIRELEDLQRDCYGNFVSFHERRFVERPDDVREEPSAPVGRS